MRCCELYEKNFQFSISESSFTITEFLIVISILIILATISVSVINNIQPDLKLSGTARNLVSDIRYTQQLTVTEQVDHGIYFSTTTRDKYSIIRHENGTTTIKEEFLPEGINFYYISPLINNEVRFNPYGAVKEGATTTLINIKGKTITIKISPSGFVKIID